MTEALKAEYMTITRSSGTGVVIRLFDESMKPLAECDIEAGDLADLLIEASGELQ